jgi:Rhs element Vgr protein
MTVVTATILKNNVRMNPEYEVLSIDVVKEINRIPYAQIILLDGDAPKRAFKISHTDFFEPGQLIDIQLHYEGKSANKQSVFKGLVTQHKIQSSIHQSLLIIELKDTTFRLTTQRQNRVFSGQGTQKITDSDIIQQILKQTTDATPDITIGSIESTQATHREMVQFYCTDWDFILSRAESNGQWIIVENGQITVALPKLSGQPNHYFEYGISDIYDFEIDADIQHQYGVVQATAWDEANQQLYPAPKQAKDFSLSQGNLSPAKLAAKIGTDQYDLVTMSPLEETEAQAWANAQMIKSRLSMLRGRLQVPGFADIHLGEILELDGVGLHFKGKTVITGIRHQVSTQGWVMDIQFGLPATWFAQKRDIVDVPAAGLLPAVNGLQIGVVDTYVEDPDKRFRVRVKVPLLSTQTEGLIWARLATLDAGQQRGICFRPKPGDEVVLGFLNDDPRQAIILGSLHSEKNQPPLPETRENTQHGIVTKEGLKLIFEDRDKSIRLETPGTNRIVLIDQDGAIYIVDENNNQFMMNSNGIQISSDKDIKITAKGSITLQGKSVDVK